MSILIIAEAGVNHNGSLAMAKQLADVAKAAGADIVKFHTAKPELVISRFAEKAEYQKAETGEAESQLEMCKRIHLTFDEHAQLKEYCDSIGIAYLSTPFDLDSIDFLQQLGTPMWKVPSGEITNLPYLEKIAATKKPVILSTGMSMISEIEDALTILEDGGAGPITLVHCNTEYPTPIEDANLLAMQDLREQFGLPVGYSDHTAGIEADIAAAALGAVVIEKHFTLDKALPGPDHKASLSPEELTAMVAAVRKTELALGDGRKHVTESEAKNKPIARKSILAKRDIKKGETFTPENLTVKRPGDGISPMRWYDVLGKTAKRDFAEDEKIELSAGCPAKGGMCRGKKDRVRGDGHARRIRPVARRCKKAGAKPHAGRAPCGDGRASGAGVWHDGARDRGRRRAHCGAHPHPEIRHRHGACHCQDNSLCAGTVY